jgi:hypothetical protein
MRCLGLGRAQFAVDVDAARQQVVQQPLLDGLELGDDCLGFVDGGVEGVEDLGDLALLFLAEVVLANIAEQWSAFNAFMKLSYVGSANGFVVTAQEKQRVDHSAQ